MRIPAAAVLTSTVEAVREGLYPGRVADEVTDPSEADVLLLFEDQRVTLERGYRLGESFNLDSH